MSSKESDNPVTDVVVDVIIDVVVEPVEENLDGSSGVRDRLAATPAEEAEEEAGRRSGVSCAAD